MHDHVSALRRLSLMLAALLAALGIAAVPAGAVSVTSLEKSVVNRAHGELVEGVHEPYGDNRLAPANQPYDIGAPWCGSFLNWVMKASGVDPQAPNRGSWNVNVAKAWGKYGPLGGGYGRWASAKNALPGDILVYRYDGTATTGGHVTMVVANTSDPRYVWTIGGNEGNRVRLQKRDLLAASDMYLVTLSEFRNRKTDIWSEASGAPRDVGDLFTRRFSDNMVPSAQVTKIIYKGTTYSGSTLGNSGFRVKTSSGSLFGITSIMRTRSYDYLVADRNGDQGSMTTNDPVIDYNRASSHSGTS
jgi:hypothetical protein